MLHCYTALRSSAQFSALLPTPDRSNKERGCSPALCGWFTFFLLLVISPALSGHINSPSNLGERKWARDEIVAGRCTLPEHNRCRRSCHCSNDRKQNLNIRTNVCYFKPSQGLSQRQKRILFISVRHPIQLEDKGSPAQSPDYWPLLSREIPSQACEWREYWSCGPIRPTKLFITSPSPPAAEEREVGSIKQTRRSSGWE